ncbi:MULTISPECIES: hypothetical protein [unclassified Bradyrhizobium]|nr:MULTISPECIES: hypothetical protein [unclassified Bradyrhizobium]
MMSGLRRLSHLRKRPVIFLSWRTRLSWRYNVAIRRAIPEPTTMPPRPPRKPSAEHDIPEEPPAAAAGRVGKALHRDDNAPAQRSRRKAEHQAFLRFAKAARKVGLIVSRETYDRFYKDMSPCGSEPATDA